MFWRLDKWDVILKALASNFDHLRRFQFDFFDFFSVHGL